MDRVSPVNFTWGNNKSWAIANKNKGALSFASGIIGTASGCIKAFTYEDSFVNKITGFIQSIAYGIRSHCQYSIYFRKEDDDLGEDIHTRPHAANIGEIACFIERKINPFVLSLLPFLNKKASNGYSSIAHLTNALWWRIRLFSKKINWERFNKYLIEDFKSLFGKDMKEQKFARQNIESTITPPLGLLGFCFTGLFTPIRAWFKFKGTENRLINSLSSVGTATQHIIYFFRFTLPELFNAKENKSRNSKVLFAIGACANTMNTLLPVVDILPSGDGVFGKSQKLYIELASGFTAAFFSSRRYFMGKEWLRN